MEGKNNEVKGQNLEQFEMRYHNVRHFVLLLS